MAMSSAARERELSLAGTAGRTLSRAEARTRARARWRRDHDVNQRDHERMLDRFGHSDIVRRGSFAPGRTNSGTKSGTRATDETGDGRTLVGYAATFGDPTLIDSVYEGTFREVIAPGAFRDSIRARTPQLQYDHGGDPRMGSLPIGRINDIREDSRGLRVEARLFRSAEPVREAIAGGGIRGMSFRFRVVRDEWTRGQGNEPDTRVIRAADVLELGPVAWPAYESTSVSVRKALPNKALTPAQRRAKLRNMKT